jgi:hypothetical protein
LFLGRLRCPLDTGWFGRVEPWGLAMDVDGGALVIGVGAGLEIAGGATLVILDGVGTVAGAVLFWLGPTIVRAPDWTPAE